MQRPGITAPTGSVRSVWRALAAIVIVAFAITSESPAAISPGQVLLLYNSQDSDSLAVRNAYIAARPGVREFDLNDATLPSSAITRAAYISKVRDPLRAHLNTAPSGVPLAQEIIAIATTHGLPARINGVDAAANEFSILSTYASLESELSLLFQDLEVVGESTVLPARDSSLVDNPYHLNFTPVESFNRSSITTPRSFSPLPDDMSAGYWSVSGLTPGDMYLVCRLDAAALNGNTEVENTEALIARSTSLSVDTRIVQAILDEHSNATEQFDDDGAGDDFPDTDDFAATAATLATLDVRTSHDEGFDFITGSEVVDPQDQIIVLGSYGENHKTNGWGEDPPGAGTYTSGYTNLHPAAVFISYESFNGHSLITGNRRQNQGLAAEFIASGGGFAIAHVAEPFTFTVADLNALVGAMYIDGLTFAEAAYISMPVLSWQNTPIGDPLAIINVFTSAHPADLNADGVIDGADLAVLLAAWGETSSIADITDDGVVDGADLAALLAAWTP